LKRVKDSRKSKEDILNAAEMLFSQKGLYGTRVDDIAVMAKINKRMIYEYFGSKVDLYKEVLTKVYSKIGNTGKAVIRQDMVYTQAVKNAAAFYFNYLNAHPTYVNLLLWENLNQGEYISKVQIKELNQPVLEDLQKIIERDQKNGTIRSDFESKFIITALLTSTFAYFSNRYTLSKLLQYDFKSIQSIQKRAEDLAEMMIAYIQKTKEEEDEKN